MSTPAKPGDGILPAPCRLGHHQRSYECPACAEALGFGEQPIEHWRWFRTRTSSKRIKSAIDDYLTSRSKP